MGPERLARWLFCPTVAVAAHWCLLASPGRLLGALPQLWSPGGSTSSTGEEAQSGGDGGGADLTPEDLLNEFLNELDARRTTYDRVGGAVLVAGLWIGIVLMMVPPLLLFCGPLASSAAKCCRRALHPLVQLFHRWGCFEAGAYALALTLSAQGCRHAPEPFGAGAFASLAGGLAFAPCWAYSTLLHAEQGAERWRLALVAGSLGAALEAGVLLPLALVHKSPLIGFLAVAALHGSLAAGVHCLGRPRARGGFDPGSGVHCCLLASALLTLGATLLRSLGSLPDLHAFASGLAVFGHIGYLLATLALASKWRSSWETYIERQAFAVLSLLVAFCWGWLLSVPGLTCASWIFTLLFVLEKELESKFDNVGVKVLATYIFLQYLYSQRQHLPSVLEPARLYL